MVSVFKSKALFSPETWKISMEWGGAQPSIQNGVSSCTTNQHNYFIFLLFSKKCKEVVLWHMKSFSQLLKVTPEVLRRRLLDKSMTSICTVGETWSIVVRAVTVAIQDTLELPLKLAPSPCAYLDAQSTAIPRAGSGFGYYQNWSGIAIPEYLQ